MKTLILILSFIIGSGVVANAQTVTGQLTPQQRADRVTKVLSKRLKLSSNQVAQVNAIQLSGAMSMDSLKTSVRPARRNTAAVTRRSIAMNTDQKMYAVLNTDQKKVYMQFVDDQKAKRMARQGVPLQTPVQSQH